MKKKLYTSLAVLLTVILIFSGCTTQKTLEGNSDVNASVYYIQENGTSLVEMKVSIPEESDEKMAENLVECLLTPPDGMKSPLCEGTKLKSVQVEAEIAKVDFTKDFSNFNDPAYALEPAAVAKTLCSLDAVSGVNILVEGQPALGVDGTPIGVIMESDVVDVTVSGDTKKATVTLYFANDTAEGLTTERREIEISASSTLEKAVIEELIKGPKNQGGISIIPVETKVLSVETKNSVCFVNLSKEFVDKYQGGTVGEILTIYPIVNSLTELDGISSVQFLIEGEKRETFSHIAISEPLVRDNSIIMK